MIPADLILKNAHQLVTFQNEDLSLESDALAARDGVIVWLGKTADLGKSVQPSKDCQVLDAADKVVLPGLIDSHTHLVFGGSRENEFDMRCRGATYEEIAAAGGGIKSTMRSTRAETAELLFEKGTARLNTMLALGVTTVEIKSGYGLDLVNELKILEVINRLGQTHPADIVPTFLGAHTVPPEFLNDRDGYVDLVIHEMIPEVTRRKLAVFCDVFCETNVFTVDETQKVFEAARQSGLKLTLHADQLTNTGGAELAASMGATSADHLENISEKGIEALAASGTVAGLLPGCSFFLNMQYPPARKLIERGIPVALATDFNPGSCTTENLPLIMTIACTQMKMTPEEVIKAVTLNAAKSIDRDDVGNLAVGLQADFVIFDVPDFRYIPYHFGHNHAEQVVKRGQTVFSRS